MKTPIETLIQKAKAAPKIAPKSNHLQFVPVVEVLIKERGFSIYKAVRWLVERGEIDKKSEQNAYQSFATYYRKLKKKGVA